MRRRDDAVAWARKVVHGATAEKEVPVDPSFFNKNAVERNVNYIISKTPIKQNLPGKVLKILCKRYYSSGRRFSINKSDRNTLSVRESLPLSARLMITFSN